MADYIQTSDKANNALDDNQTSLPNPRVSRSVKNTKKWQRDTINYYINNKDNYRGPRRSVEQMTTNWNFFNGHLTQEQLHKALDPLNLSEDVEADMAEFEFYDIIQQPLKTLFGEALKRKNDVKALAINPDIINSKDRMFKEEVKKYLNSLVEKDKISEEELQKGLEEFDMYRKHDLQSAHEKMANQLLNLFRKDKLINAKQKFNEGFKNYQINLENIYHVYRSGNLVDFRPVDSKNFYVLGLTDNWIENAQCWIEENYMHPYKIIETFPDLTDTEIKSILNYSNIYGEGGALNGESILYDGRIDNTQNAMHGIIHNELPIGSSFAMLPTGSSMDENGNILVTTVEWRGLRKIGKLEYIDSKTGETQSRWVDEYHEADLSKGEKITWKWFNEIMRGHKIGHEIYHDIKPLESQMRSQINPSIVRPSYVGYIHFNSGGQSKSRLETLMPYQRDYNLYANKLKKLWAQHIGKVAVIDVARIPSKMTTEEWFEWLKKFNISFENSFEMGKEGMATGLLAGNNQRGANTMDLSMMGQIQEVLQMLEYNERMVNKQSGVPEARQGNLTGQEGLGTSQQAIISSSNQTEEDFFIQDMVMVKVAEVWLELKKIVGKEDKQTIQYLSDDLSQDIIEFDGELLNETDYAVQITDSSSSFEMTQKVNQLVHPAMQNGMIGLVDALKTIEGTPSEIINKLEVAEENKRRQQKDMEDQKAKNQQELFAMQEKAQNDAWLRRKEEIDLQFKYDILKIEANNKQNIEAHMRDTNQNNIEDQVELDKITIKAKADAEEAEKQRQHEILLQEKDLKAKVAIANKKSKSS